MNLAGKKIRDYEEVFQCAYAERAGTISWTKWPVARASLAFKRLMGTVTGHTAFCVFNGLVRICARFKTGGDLTVKGQPISVADIHSETGIPAKMISPALHLLNSEPIGWIIPCAQEVPPKYGESTTNGTSRAPESVSVSASSSPSLLPEPPRVEKNDTPVPTRAERVWQACDWKRVGKQAGIKAIQTAEKRVAAERFDGDLDAASEYLRARAAAYSASRIVQTTPSQYLPHPATWFNQGRYDDDPREWGKARTGADADQVPVGGSTLDAVLRQVGMEATNGTSRGGRNGAVPGAALPTMEGHGGACGALG